ncbi:hypothetical protein ANO11243_040920 [Dothideomycetidae sp. 11243]|nr:hypothetical protein ANO11243_040920 [fungal sp. No.11243]
MASQASSPPDMKTPFNTPKSSQMSASAEIHRNVTSRDKSKHGRTESIEIHIANLNEPLVFRTEGIDGKIVSKSDPGKRGSGADAGKVKQTLESHQDVITMLDRERRVNRILGNDHNKLQIMHARLCDEFTSLDNKHTSLREDHARVHKEFSTMYADHTGLYEEHMALLEKHDRLKRAGEFFPLDDDGVPVPGSPDFKNIKQQLTEAIAEVKELEDQEDQLNVELSSKERRISELEKNQTGFKTELKTKERQINELEDQLCEISNKLNEALGRLKDTPPPPIPEISPLRLVSSADRDAIFAPHSSAPTSSVGTMTPQSFLNQARSGAERAEEPRTLPFRTTSSRSEGSENPFKASDFLSPRAPPPKKGGRFTDTIMKKFKGKYRTSLLFKIEKKR